MDSDELSHGPLRLRAAAADALCVNSMLVTEVRADKMW